MAFEDTTGHGDGWNSPVLIVGFPMDEVLASLDGEGPDFKEAVRAGVVEAFGRLLRTLLFDPRGKVRDAAGIGRQLLAVAYSAEMVDGLSLAEIGGGEGISKQGMSKRLREVKDRLGLKSHLSSSDSTRETLRAAQLARHEEDDGQHEAV